MSLYACVKPRANENPDKVAEAIITSLEDRRIIKRGEDVTYSVVLGLVLIFRSPLDRVLHHEPKGA